MSESDLAEVPGTQFARQKLLATAQRYYQELGDTQQVSAEVAAPAAFPLGQLQASLRHYDNAQASFNKVLAYQAVIAAAKPSDSAACLALANTHYAISKLGEKLWNEQDPNHPSKDAAQGLELMLDHAAQCIEWRAKAHELDPKNRETSRLLANAKMGLAVGKIELQRIEPQPSNLSEAGQLLAEAQSIRQDLLKTKPDDAKMQADLARGYVGLADLRIAEAEAADLSAEDRDERLNESVELREQAIAVFKGLSAEAFTRDSQYDLANCYQACGTSYAKIEDYAKASDYYELMGMIWIRCS